MAKEETEQKLFKAQEFIDNGLSIEEACQRAGVTSRTYRTYNKPKKRRGRPKKTAIAKSKRYVETIITPHTPQRLTCLIGEPQEIAATLRGLTL